jgi:hypothetical protein
MLAHSRDWIARGATPIVADARASGLLAASAGLIVASLADPFNDGSLWREIRRLLRPGGVVIMTTPSYSWARAFRREGQRTAFNSAEFETPGGPRVALPSLIIPEAEQATVVADAGLQLVAIRGRRVSDVPEAARAPKLQGVPVDANFVTAYVCAAYDH